MIEVLEPLARIPGVRVAALVSPEGMPMAARGRISGTGQPPGASERSLDEEAGSVAGLATIWLGELTRAAGLLSCEGPTRVVLRASRGTLVLMHAPGAILLTILERGASPEDLRLPMEGAVARMQRILRGMGASREASTAERERARGPQGPLPARTGDPAGTERTRVETNQNEAPGQPGSS